jgi:hypothetical protein
MFDEVTGVDFPLFQSQVEDTFGEPSEEGEFAEKYLTVIDLNEFSRYLINVRDYEGNSWSCRIYGNYFLERPLKMAFQAMVERDVTQQLKTFDGCFNIRPPKSGKMQYSMHAYGLAVDFNAATNRFNYTRMRTDFSDKFVQCFLDAGFEWGGLWKSPFDPMHFQLPWIKDWREVESDLKPRPFQAP